jgi:large subunit ribosomal protein L15
MNLSNLPKITERQAKRIGRGYGSGKGGHTVGKGNKGEKARGDIPLTFAGTKMKKSLLKRLPFMRGKGKNKSFSKDCVIIDLDELKDFPNGSTVDVAALVKAGLVQEDEANYFGVKILGDGELKVALKVKLAVSGGARSKIEKAGGQILVDKNGAKMDESVVEVKKETKRATAKKTAKKSTKNE